MASINLLLIGLFMVVTILAAVIFSPSMRWVVLLGTTLIFYYLLVGEKLLLALTLALVIYCGGLVISKRPKWTWLFIALLLVPLLLASVFEAGNHFSNYNLRHISGIEELGGFDIFQMLGLSYFTFNGLSYLFDIKRKYIGPQKNFFILLLYLLYLPHIFSGPLHRAKYLFAQFRNIEFSEANFTNGFRLILFGLFKNIVLAQRLFILLRELLETDISGLCYLLAGLLFFLYLYCNFSSFIDFFQGVSEIFGIRLKNNFRNRTYLSSSRQHFWQGWHITLNEWFRDYYFFAIAKHDRNRKYTNTLLLSTFILIAIWHGFTQVLLVWGIVNGLWIIIEKKVPFEKWPYPRLRKYAGILYHLTFSSVLALIFISPDVNHLINKVVFAESYFPGEIIKTQFSNIAIIALAFMIMDFWYARSKDVRFDEFIQTQHVTVRWATYFILGAMILTFGVAPGINAYYMQF